MRSPKRTAQTAAALMVGLALVSTIAVFGASLSQSATGSIDQALRADYIVTGGGNGGPATGFSTSVATTAASIPGVTAVTSVYNGQFLFGSSVATLGGVTTPGLAETINLRMQSGSGEPALAVRPAADRHHHRQHQAPRRRGHRARHLRPDRARDHPDRRDLRAERRVRQLPGRRRVLPRPLRHPAADRRPDHVVGRHQSVGPGGGDPRAPALSEREGPDPGRVQEDPAGTGQPTARHHLRPAGPGRPHRPHRDRQHADAVGVRADPRDRPPAGGRDASTPGAGHDPRRGGDPLDLRRRHRGASSGPASGWRCPSR